MRTYVIIATKGRVPEVARLVVELARQTRVPDKVVVVGTNEADVAAIDRDALGPGRLAVLVSDRAGASRQRNFGIEHLEAAGGIAVDVDAVVAFFDDDFRPATNWLEEAVAAFEARPDALALGGELLLNETGTPEDKAAALIAADSAARATAPADPVRDGYGLYGCNVAVRGAALVETRYDEGLPLYSWLEDADLSVRIKRRGALVFAPRCRGVHLNTVGGRTSGVRFGYSQVANPVYLKRRGTMTLRVTAKLVAQALAANLYRSVHRRPEVDHPGRLSGNLRAVWDVVRGRDRPDRILELRR